MYNQMNLLEKMFKDDSENAESPSPETLEEYILQRGQEFKARCQDFSNYLYFLSQCKWDAARESRVN